MEGELRVDRVELGRATVWFTDRRGGVSRPPYDTLNVGEHVGDDRDAVVENRRRVARAIASGTAVPADPDEWVWLRQVHGATVLTVTGTEANGHDADAVVSGSLALPLVVQVADCVPVALASATLVGAVHAGWKGLEAGVIPRAVEAFDPSPRKDLRAWIGPCVMPCHYAFGPKDLERLTKRFGPGAAGRTLAGQPALDLPRAVELALRDAGVARIERSGACTAHDPARWFSHRRDARTGRHAMVVARLR